jgi:segregation and condensation protein A
MAEKNTGPALGYHVKLPLFEGPLDLLLFLIQRDEIDIYDIPIARITEEYLRYLRLMRLLQLDVAAEFLVMAATLMSIKSQLLLPQPLLPEDLLQEDPRQELADRLLEYRLFKTAAQTLAEREDHSVLLYSRPGEPQWTSVEQEEDLIEVNLFDLFTAFEEIIEREPKLQAHDVELEEITVKERYDYILEILSSHKKVPFIDLIRADPRTIVMVVTFLALLELMRAKIISVKQQKAFGQIWIFPRSTPSGSELQPFPAAR